ncbi:MAG TPA: cation transporter [Tissierellales bacterium]|nr:cation transporter [Tissierellales bacterium]
MKKTITIEGMSCGHCVAAVEKALKELDNISKVDVNLENKKAQVEGVNLNDSVLKKVIDEAGYEVVEIR